MKGRNFIRTVISFVAVAVILYIGLYVLLSYNGEYKFRKTGPIKGKVEWYPAGCDLRRLKSVGEEEKWDGNFGGFAFFPLIYVDRGLWHKQKPLSEHVIDEAKKAFQDGDDE